MLHLTVLMSLPKVMGLMVNILLLPDVAYQTSNVDNNTASVACPSHLLPSSCNKSIPHKKRL
jgi:hypothetical protein